MTTRTAEFQADFESGTQHDLGTSTARRPDAISLDYLTAFSTGPLQVGDPSAGVQARRWRVRVFGTAVYLSRSNTTNVTWEAESLLFEYEGAYATECSLAFTRFAWPIVVLQRPTGTAGADEIWMYWRDPALI